MDGGGASGLVAALVQTMALKLLPQPPAAVSAFPFLQTRRGNGRQPPGPLFDVALQLANDPLGCLDELNTKYGSVVGLRLLNQPVVLVSDPDYAKDVFFTLNHVFVKTGTAFFPGSALSGNGLIVSDGEMWKRQRRLANPLFRKSAINAYAKAMVDRTQEMLERKWRKGGVHNIYADFNSLTTEIVASSLFGGSSGEENLTEVGPAISDVFLYFARRGTSMLIIPEWVPTPDNLQFLAAMRELDSVTYRLISERRRLVASGTTVTDQNNALGVRKDLLTRLVEATDEDGSGMDDTALRDELMTFLIAGQDTLAILLTWALAFIANYPEVQRRIYAECVEVFGDGFPTHSDVPKLRYMEAVIWETMRMWSPAYVVGRCASEDTKLGPYDVPAGTTVLVSQYILHRDPAYWPRATEFLPERWLPGGGATPHMENNSYWPFGGGPRNCIGTGFAMMEATLVLSTIVRHVNVRIPAGGSLPKPNPTLTLSPEDVVDVVFSKRRTSVPTRKQPQAEIEFQGCPAMANEVTLRT